jgi:hypothetical protein
MLCDLCNGSRSIVIGSISFKSKPLGTIFVPGIRHSTCRGCGEISIDFEETKKINAYVEKKEAEAILSLPIGDFISLNEAAIILGKTKQAFSKDSRIKRGFIYSVMVDNRKLYYKKSVEAFKQTGKDGRILINPKVIEIYRPSHQHKSNITAYYPYNKTSNIMREITRGIEPKDVFTKNTKYKKNALTLCKTAN